MGEPGLSPEDIQAMRRKVVAAAQSTPDRRRDFRLTVAVAILLACVVTVGVVMRTRSTSEVGPITTPEPGARRQLQFETPGGTRIIWVLNPEFQM